MTSFDVDSSPTAIAVIARSEDPCLQFVIVNNIYSGLYNVKTGVTAVEEHHLLISNVDGRGNSDKGMVNTTLM